MKKKITTLTIAILPLMNVKLGHVKTLVKNMVSEQHADKVTLDLTDVDICTTEKSRMGRIAEALQEVGICDPVLAAGKDCRFQGKAIKAFQHILKRLEARTVRIVYGDQLNQSLDETHNVREAGQLLNDPEGGCVRFLRFRTEAEAKAYLLGVGDADGWLSNNTVGNFNANVVKASRTISVEPV